MTFYLTSYLHGARKVEQFNTSYARSVAARILVHGGWTHLDGETRHMNFGFS